jgi:hypothetical protein
MGRDVAGAELAKEKPVGLEAGWLHVGYFIESGRPARCLTIRRRAGRLR